MIYIAPPFFSAFFSLSLACLSFKNSSYIAFLFGDISATTSVVSGLLLVEEVTGPVVLVICPVKACLIEEATFFGRDGLEEVLPTREAGAVWGILTNPEVETMSECAALEDDGFANKPLGNEFEEGLL